MSSSAPNKMNSIEKALAVMRVLSSPGGPHRLADIANQPQLNSPSVHRILQTLIANNYAVAIGDGTYAAGLGMRALGAATSDDLVSAATPVLESLQSSTGHTVHFAAFTGNSAVYVAKVEGSRPYQMRSRVGMPIKLHRTSIGKSILAALPADEAEGLIRAELSAEGADAPSLETLLGQLEEIRARGFSLDDEENEANIRCVGAVVRNAKGAPIGGISLSEIAFVLELPQLIALGSTVMEAAGSISSLAGYSEAKPSGGQA